MAAILKVTDLTVRFNKSEPVLDELSFELTEGESLAIIGPNGSGKTVLLKALLRTLPYTGAVTWEDKVRIGYVPQKIEADKHLPINFKNIFQAKADLMRLATAEMTNAVKTVGLSPDILAMPIGFLSGGQFQKCLIAFALLGSPNVLLFDEPTASIDQPREEQIYELLHRLQDEYGLTIILVSHDLSFVYRYATQVLCLNKRNICFGAPRDVLNQELLAKLYGTNFKYYHHLHDTHN